MDNSRGAAGRRSAYPPTQLSGSHTATADTFGPERDSRGAPAESRGASLSTSRNESRQETRNRPASHSRSQSGKASSAGAAAAKLKPPSSSDIGHGAGTRRADGGPHFKPPSRGSLDTSSQAVASSGGHAAQRRKLGHPLLPLFSDTCSCVMTEQKNANPCSCVMMKQGVNFDHHSARLLLLCSASSSLNIGLVTRHWYV